MTTKEMIAVMQAFEEGKTIEYNAKWGSDAGKWDEIDDPVWDWHACNYRVKPEPKEFYVVGYSVGGTEETFSEPRTLEQAEFEARSYNKLNNIKTRVLKMREVLDES